LAHQLQALAAALLAGALAGTAAEPFSHAVHLGSKVKLACVTCHVEAPRSTKVADQLRPGAGLCAKCHPDSRTFAPRARAELLVAKFSHAQHVKLQRCEQCHGGVVRDAAKPFPPMADCLICHNRIDPPYSCETCHEDVKALTPASHDAKWVDTHTDPKIAKQDCASCHGRNFRCQGCH
jgi:hypothetical protein